MTNVPYTWQMGKSGATEGKSRAGTIFYLLHTDHPVLVVPIAPGTHKSPTLHCGGLSRGQSVRGVPYAESLGVCAHVGGGRFLLRCKDKDHCLSDMLGSLDFLLLARTLSTGSCIYSSFIKQEDSLRNHA